MAHEWSYIPHFYSKYPIDLLKDAGVDMTTDEPLDLTMKAMARVMDEMGGMLAKRGR